jgi:uncharacterized protein
MKSVQNSAYWKKRYDLVSHPEGGWYREIYRASLDIFKNEHERSVSTAIIYLLENADFSAFHRIKSDEIWHLYDADTSVKIHCIRENGNYVCLELGYEQNALPCCVVPANVWFAVELVDKTDSFALCGCTVSPGFDFRDFEMAKPSELVQAYPMHEELIQKLSRDLD